MVIILKQHIADTEIQAMESWLVGFGVKAQTVRAARCVIGLSGDTSGMDIDVIRAHPLVESAQRISRPYRGVSRKQHPSSTVLDICGRAVGEGTVNVMAGPCAVESEDQILAVARAVKAAGAAFLRGGVFKARTSPYSFQGLGSEGMKLLLAAKRETGLPIVTEIISLSHLDLFAQVDIIQVGARNMQNYELLKELGRSGKPILLKRGLASTIEELLMSAEYIYAGGNAQILLCERGIRTFETQTRNTLDLSAVPVLKRLSHLPVVVDPSHAAGAGWLVEPLAKAAVAAGADGLLIEVHNNPQAALSDGSQSLTMREFESVMHAVKKYASAEGKVLD